MTGGTGQLWRVKVLVSYSAEGLEEWIEEFRPLNPIEWGRPKRTCRRGERRQVRELGLERRQLVGTCRLSGRNSSWLASRLAEARL